jgi:L-alanine-DL-glutamate epimerase-like enolase superfamily enzyme
MARVESVKARAVRVPLQATTSFATRQVSERHYCLVEVRTEDGIKGIGFCYAGHKGGPLIALAVRELLAPVVVGQDPHRTEGLWGEMYGETLLHGRTGAVMRAISAVDTALWDRNARAAGLPLCKLLGARAVDSVAAYASGGYYLEGKGPDGLARELKGYVEAGFRAVKMKVGRLDPAGEEERIAAARAAIGQGVELMLDANNAWSDLVTALRYMERYEKYGPYWIEEPFSPDDIDNHARLAAATSIPVATGEIEAGRWRFKELLDKDAAAILQTDACVCGGVTEYRRISALAAGYGVAMCPHWFHDLHVHLVACEPTDAAYVEFFPDDQVLNFRKLVDRQLEVRDGRVVVPAEPGLGFDFDAAAVDAYAIDGWA